MMIIDSIKRLKWYEALIWISSVILNTFSYHKFSGCFAYPVQKHILRLTLCCERCGFDHTLDTCNHRRTLLPFHGHLFHLFSC